MKSKIKTVALIAAIVMVATVQVYAEDYLQQLKSSAASAQTVSNEDIPEIVIVPAVNSTGTVSTSTEMVSTSIETTSTSIAETVAYQTAEEIPQSRIYYDIPLNMEQQDIVREISAEYGVPFELVLAVMQVESNFDVTAIGNGNCYGIMQIHQINHPALEKQLGITDWLSLSDNAKAGCYMLGQLLDKYQDETRALMAYNMGESAAKKAWNAGTRSTGYTQKVQSAKQSLTEQVNEKAAG